MHPRRIALIFTLALGLPAIASAQSKCDETVRSDPQNPFRYMLRGDRCEGMFRRPYGADALIAILSLTSGSVPVARRPMDISLAWPLETMGTLSIVAETIAGPNYRMDTQQMASLGEYRWKADIFRQTGVAIDQLGVLATLTNSRMLVPVAVAADTGRAPVPSRALHAVVETARAFATLTFSVARVGSRGELTWTKDRDKIIAPKNAGEPIAVDFAAEAAGEYLLRVSGLADNGQTSSRDALFRVK